MAALKPEAEDPYALFKSSPNLKIYYFIGRLNPPHEGHIAALTKMIEEANANNSVALILLGSGPFEGERTMDNPIPYDLKVDFLRYKLPRDLHYVIQTMTQSADDVTLWYQTILSHIKPPLSVEFIRYAGDKDGNVGKSKYVDDTLLNRFPTSKAYATPVNAKMANANTAHSATSIRKFAYNTYLKNGTSGFAAFDAKYKPLYGEFTKKMYDAIIYPILHPKQLSPEEIQIYIDTGKIPMSDARRALAARKKEEKEARNAAAKKEKSMATVAASLGNAVTAKKEAKSAKGAGGGNTSAGTVAAASGNAIGARNSLRETKKASAAKKSTKGPAKASVPKKGTGGRETRGGGTKKRRHRKTQKKSNSK
jgi:nicotinamide mononucleotide adenylyltransferase